LLLLAHITGKNKLQLLLEENIPEEQARVFFNALERRVSGEPLQYILGEWDFYGLTFKVDKRALIPRPETELLVEEVLALNPLRVLDICTGSGCIAVSLAVFLKDAEITAVDISADALALARENAEWHGVAHRVRFVQSDLAGGLLREPGQGFDAIVSNPPYIPTGELHGLQTEVRDFEPHLALDGGVDGMDLYRKLLPQAKALLRPGGALFLEIGPGGVGELATAAGFGAVRIKKDYSGLDRVVIAFL